MSVIQVENLTKHYRVYQKNEGVWAAVRGLFKREYREVQAVRGISLQIEPGEFVAFLGPNGSGKTTTLKMLSGVIHPTSGSATVLGYVPWQRSNEYRRRFALVMGQKNQLWWDLPALESFRLHQQIYHIPTADYERTLEELTTLLDIKRLLRQPIRELSLGERMKMELTAALIHSPEVLFLDEPTIGLDVVAQHNIQQFLKHYQESRRVTIMLTSHYMKDVTALCQRVVVIAHGQIHYDGPLREIVGRFSGHKYVTLQLSLTESTAGFEKFGEVLEVIPPKVKLKIDRPQVAKVLAAILAQYTIDDVVVEDPPLEQVISEVFEQAEHNQQTKAEGGRGKADEVKPI